MSLVKIRKTGTQRCYLLCVDITKMVIEGDFFFCTD